MDIKKIALFLVITFSISWTMISVFIVSGGKWNTPSSLLIAVIYMFVPVTAAFIVNLIYKENFRDSIGLSFKLNPWFLVAWLLPLFITFLSVGSSLMMPGVSYSPGMEGMYERFGAVMTPQQMEEMKLSMRAMPVHPFFIGIIQGLLAGASINTIAAFGEEAGWRGFLQKELKALKFWKASLLIGFIWGVWHAPIVLQGHNYPQHPKTGVIMMVAWCMLLGPLFSYVRIKSGSVLAAALVHGTLNATAGLALLLIRGGNDLTVGITGIAGFIVLIVVNTAIFIYERYFAAQKIDSI